VQENIILTFMSFAKPD